MLNYKRKMHSFSSWLLFSSITYNRFEIVRWTRDFVKLEVPFIFFAPSSQSIKKRKKEKRLSISLAFLFCNTPLSGTVIASKRFVFVARLKTAAVRYCNVQFADGTTSRFAGPDAYFANVGALRTARL